MKPIRVDTSRFQMLDKDRWDSACAVCQQTTAKWEMRGPGLDGKEAWAAICSMCFLYKSNWGKTHSENISSYLSEVVSKETKRKMLLSPEGKLLSSPDADFILGVLVLTSRRFDIEDMAAGVR